jgi:hypothetical protein
MATRGPQPTDGTAARLPGVVPFDVPQVTRLSWELGTSIVSDAVELGTWERGDGRWTLSTFRATSETVLIRVQTPTGRERFYGAAEMDLQSVRPRLTNHSRWERIE